MRFLAVIVFLIFGVLVIGAKPISEDCLTKLSLGIPCDESVDTPETAADTYQIPQVLLDPITFEPIAL